MHDVQQPFSLTVRWATWLQLSVSLSAARLMSMHVLWQSALLLPLILSILCALSM